MVTPQGFICRVKSWNYVHRCTVEHLYNGYIGDRRKWPLTLHQDSLKRAYALFIIFCIYDVKITVVVAGTQLRFFSKLYMKTYHSEEHKRMLPHHAHIQLYMCFSCIHDASFFYKMKKVEILKRLFFVYSLIKFILLLSA